MRRDRLEEHSERCDNGKEGGLHAYGREEFERNEREQGGETRQRDAHSMKISVVGPTVVSERSKVRYKVTACTYLVEPQSYFQPAPPINPQFCNILPHLTPLEQNPLNP